MSQAIRHQVVEAAKAMYERKLVNEIVYASRKEKHGKGRVKI